MVNIGLTLLMNTLPLLILIVPLLLIWKKTIGKLYFRIVIGIVVFYLIYWILPIIFQIGAEPVELTIDEASQGNTALGLSYFAAHFGNLVINFASYPLITLPFIFFVAPFIALIFVWNRLRNEEGSIKDNLQELTYEYTQSPFKKIRNELQLNDWSREKNILKLMIVLLPISLYLLQVILDISNLQTVSLTEGTTALGWFIEILFVYLAVFIFSIELLFSSQIALKGRYFGENIREQTFKSLYQVGAPISILSLILFIIQYTESIGIIIYFFAYFIMASIIFILFLDIFEPISILIFIKLVDWWRNKSHQKKDIDKTNLLMVVIIGVAVFIVYMVSFIILAFIPLYQDANIIIEAANYAYDNPSLIDSMGIDLMNTISNSLTFGIIILAAIALAYGFKLTNNIALGLIAFLPALIFMSILLNFPDEFWTTGQVSYTAVFGEDVYTLRTAAFNADLFVGGNITLLGVIAQPYIYTRYIFNIFFWALIFYYIKKDFMIKNIPLDDKYVEKTIFTSADDFPKPHDYIKEKFNFLIRKNSEMPELGAELNREDIREILSKLENDELLYSLTPIEENEKKRFYYTLKYLYTNNVVQLWKPEFSFKLEKVELQNLYMIFTDGRDVFNYGFVEGGQDPALISGMFSAITSFIQETTQSKQLLRTIDHGDITILIEYGRYIFGALFVKGKQTTEVRAQLKEFVKHFEEKHESILPNWNGALSHFENDHLLVEEIFAIEK
ncbi:MAG: hypothetical protein ACTSR8_15450 [Promethearchaeota archaeon]